MPSQHSHEPCESCELQASGLTVEQALSVVAERTRTAIAQYGWAAHVIPDASPATAHTQGLMETYEHPDLQVVLPADPATLQRLLRPLAEAVKAGRIFHPGDEAEGVFNVPVRFAERGEGGRQVLRALFPDPQGRFPGDPGVDPEWGKQLLDPA